MKAYLYLDVETTGLNPTLNDVVQLACIPIINGVEHAPFNEFCQPTNWNNIDDGAVKVHGITRERMLSFQPSAELVDKFVRYLSSFNVKFVMSGYNTNFDRSFVAALFQKAGRQSHFSSLFSSEIRDVYARAKGVKDKLKTTKFKLVNLAEEFGIEIDAHEAMSDIRATYLVDMKIAEIAGEEFAEISIVDEVRSLNIAPLPQLHVHSEYSNTDSVVSVEDWILWAHSNSVSAISFPDHHWAASLYKSINKKSVLDKIKKLHKISIPEDAITVVPSISLNVSLDGKLEYFRLNAWATSDAGYYNLLKLASLGWDESREDSEVRIAVVSLDKISKYREGVVFGTGCEKGLIGKLLLDASIDLEGYVKEVRRKLGSLVLELIPVDVTKYFSKGIGFRSYQDVPNLTELVNRTISGLIDSHGYDFIISSTANFISPDDKVLQDVVSKSSFKDKRFFYESRHQRSMDEQYAILKRHLGDWMSLDVVEKARSNAMKIVERSKTINIKHEYHLPKIEIPQSILDKTDDYDKQLYFLLMAKVKEHGRWSDDPVYVARFKKELEVIWKNPKLNFLPYFLMYEDICAFARAKGILQNLARGSAGGCLISYYLKIIHVNPIEEKLPFERFLSHARINAGSFPDIDLDLGNRSPVLKYLQEKYGVGFAQIGTFQRFKTKNALKDAMFAIFGRSRTDKEVMDICSTIPDSPQGLDEADFLYGYVDSEGVYHRGHLETNETLQSFFRQYPEIEYITKRLIGLPKGMGRHASAFVISTLDISQTRVPTMVFDDEELGPVPVTQFEAPMVEKSGLVKADILGLTTIKTIERVVDLVKTNTGIDLLEEDDKGVQMLYRLPEDPGVYEDFYKRKTDSSFQFNTDLIKSYIKQFAPVCRKDLADLTALCRPGALDVEFIPGVSATQFYIDVRNGAREPEYVHEDLKEILEETNGVVTYQEQLMEILVKFCGYTLEESDQIRSAIAKKKRDVMTKAFDKVRTETSKHGWTLQQAEELCKVLEAYSNYSFNRSHSAAYGHLGYITMYLKRNFPLEWWTAELNNSGEEKIRHYVSILGNTIIPPSVRNPADRFTIVGNRIAAPLSTVKGLGPASIRNIIDKGPFSSFEDFVAKTNGPINSSHFWALFKAGVFDELANETESIAEARERFLSHYTKLKKIKKIPDDVVDVSPLNIFLNQREVYKCFNKAVLDDQYIRNQISDMWPAMRETKRKDIPLAFGTSPAVPVIASISVAEKLVVSSESSENGHNVRVAMIGLYQSSEHAEGVSKSGRQWSRVRVVLSDGLSTMECIKWDQKKAFRFPVDSLVYVMGNLKRGWRGSPTLEILEIEKVERNDTRSKKTL
jgi:DNA polymerase-3 subunit alpha